MAFIPVLWCTRKVPSCFITRSLSPSLIFEAARPAYLMVQLPHLVFFFPDRVDVGIGEDFGKQVRQPEVFKAQAYGGCEMVAQYDAADAVRLEPRKGFSRALARSCLCRPALVMAVESFLYQNRRFFQVIAAEAVVCVEIQYRQGHRCTVFFCRKGFGAAQFF